MKYIILSADSLPVVYLVPDCVADDLHTYCLRFLNELTRFDRQESLEITDNTHTPDKSSHRFAYDETAFIYWLNQEIHPEEISTYVETLSWDAYEDGIPNKYKTCPWFNF